MIRATEQSPIVMEEVTDPVALAEAETRHKKFERNWAWFETHAQEIYTKYRGKCICVTEGELFAADTPEEVLAMAKGAYPGDEGRFTRIIPRERASRIYAH